MTKILKILILFVFFIVESKSFAQSACPSVTVSPHSSSICNGCTTLTATVQGSVATTSYSVAQTAYTPFSFTGGTPILVNIDDTWSGVITLPFCFQFYGQTYTQCLIGSNALISFDLSNAGAYNTWPIAAAIPSSTPLDLLNCIMGPWHDIDPSVGGDINWAIYGTAPCRALVVNWNQVPMFSCNSMIATSQIVLYETTNIIDIYIQNRPNCTTWNGGYAIEGIQNAAGSAATVVPGRNYPSQWTAANDGWRFTPTGAPQYSISWMAPPNTQISTANSVTVCPTATTTYTAVVTNNSCAGPIIVTDVGTVNVGFGAPTAMTYTPSACTSNNGMATATPSGGTPPYTYVWSTAPVQNTQTAVGLAPGVYSVTVSDVSGCPSVSTVTVTSTGGLTATAVTTPNNCSANNGTATATPTGGTAPITYVWSTIPVQNTQTAVGLSGGSYSVTISDANGCSTVATCSVSSTGGFNATTSTTPTTCTAHIGTATASPSGGTTPYTYAWVTTPVQNTQTATGLGIGTFSVLITDANGCAQTFAALVSATGGITSVGTTSVPTSCAGGNNGTATATPTGGSAPFSYLWNNGQTSQTANGLTPGPYSVTVTDANGCTFPASVLVTSPTPVTFTSSVAADTCGQNEGSASVTPSGGTSPYTYMWLTSPIQSSQAAFNLASGTYTCVITDASGCTGLAGAIIGNVPGPTANFIANPQSVEILNPDITFIDYSASNIISWQWNFGDSTVSFIQNPNHSYQNEGTYLVTLIVQNSSGCIDTIEQTVTVEGFTTFYVPNSITPNADGKNDIFIPVCTRVDVNNYSMMIFDRWGNLIFKTNDFTKGWDGKVKRSGDLVQEDVYVYSITYHDLKNVERRLIGNVNVIK